MDFFANERNISFLNKFSLKASLSRRKRYFVSGTCCDTAVLRAPAKTIRVDLCSRQALDTSRRKMLALSNMRFHYGIF